MNMHPGGLEMARDVGESENVRRQPGDRKWLQLSRGGCMLPALGTRKRSVRNLEWSSPGGRRAGKGGKSRAEKLASILT
jgi:hypothetical protein